MSIGKERKASPEQSVDEILYTALYYLSLHMTHNAGPEGFAGWRRNAVLSAMISSQDKTKQATKIKTTSKVLFTSGMGNLRLA